MKNEDMFPWFELKKYHAFKNLTLVEWRDQITLRRNLKHDVSLINSESDNPLFGSYLNDNKIAEVSALISELKRNPILPTDFLNRHSLPTPVEASVKSTTVKEMRQRGTDLTLDEFWETNSDTNIQEKTHKAAMDMPYDLLCMKMRFYLMQEIKEKGIDFEEHQQIAHHFISTELERECLDYFWTAPLANVSIDLTVSDKQIESDFKAWLKNYRKLLAPAKTKDEKWRETPHLNIDSSHIQKWVNERLVQYIDLYIVSAFEKRHLGHKEAERMIYPEIAESIKDKVANTIAPNALKLLGAFTTCALDAQLQLEDKFSK
jgi:hypothetical protein